MFQEKIKSPDTITLTKKEVIKRFEIWDFNHPCTKDEYWHAQNAVGDILGWPNWWVKWIKDSL